MTATHEHMLPGLAAASCTDPYNTFDFIFISRPLFDLIDVVRR